MTQQYQHMPSREQLVQAILDRLEADADRAQAAFQASAGEVGVRYVAIDDLLPQEWARQVSEAFPAPQSMRLMDSFRERKYTTKDFDRFSPLMADITFAVQDPRVVAVVERITGIQDQQPDAQLYAGGLSAMVQGHFLGPHIDNSHEASRQRYRTLNLLYYVSPDWSHEKGGNLELWDRRVRTRTTIVSRFNRLALMETTPTSWHSVSPVVANEVRRCVSNYYFSPTSPTGTPYFNVTSFSAWPHQPFKRLLASLDGHLRQGLRKLVPQGLGRKDVYEGTRK
ncbi:2OG-Fe(II) oxygenase [Roseateles sp. DB2]|uniref:2OG-Fe(II) oxygenase n=1 Tax=Roseateles sp. DB2 TaxID=3453717 RepID=UPI003EEAF43A